MRPEEAPADVKRLSLWPQPSGRRREWSTICTIVQ